MLGGSDQNGLRAVDWFGYGLRSEKSIGLSLGRVSMGCLIDFSLQGHNLNEEESLVGLTSGSLKETSPNKIRRRSAQKLQIGLGHNSFLEVIMGRTKEDGKGSWEQSWIVNTTKYLAKSMEQSIEYFKVVNEDMLKEEQLSDSYFIEFEKELGESFGESFGRGCDTIHVGKGEAMGVEVAGMRFVQVVEPDWKKRKRKTRSSWRTDSTREAKTWVESVNLEGKVGLKGEGMLETRFLTKTGFYVIIIISIIIRFY
ncbi:unnamed protein product [Linum tenue]|uniref:Uncharacterized protein n=1 Tax=Linum tenue TaxID=586396 RepID=A0AAV0GTV9_9ROSI|nr:unnamed protein product [Linum tenue]